VHREPVVSTCLHAAKSNHAARVHVTAVEDEAQSGKAQSGKEETGAQQRLQVEERRRSGKAAKKKAFAAAAARRLAARGCATGRQAPALAALMRGVGTSHPAHELRSTPEVVSIPPCLPPCRYRECPCGKGALVISFSSGISAWMSWNALPVFSRLVTMDCHPFTISPPTKGLSSWIPKSKL